MLISLSHPNRMPVNFQDSVQPSWSLPAHRDGPCSARASAECWSSSVMNLQHHGVISDYLCRCLSLNWFWCCLCWRRRFECPGEGFGFCRKTNCVYCHPFYQGVALEICMFYLWQTHCVSLLFLIWILPAPPRFWDWRIGPSLVDCRMYSKRYCHLVKSFQRVYRIYCQTQDLYDLFYQISWRF